jgi:hypothetical protein
MATVIFFLKIAKQPPVKNVLFQEERSPVTTLLKKKSESFQETKNNTF